MSLFEHEARQFKFDVLREVSKRAFNGKINEDTCDEIADLLIPGKKADYRCCIYKEKEIIRQRTRMAENHRHRLKMITRHRLCV